MAVVVFAHFQRPSVAVNMTVDEFVRARTASDGRVVVLVSKHKTGAQWPAQVALEKTDYKLFSLFVKRYSLDRLFLLILPLPQTVAAIIKLTIV